MGKGAKPIKVCLTNRGQDIETPWATDLGPAPGPSGSRKVRLVNVPFLHAKPTWGDIIIVTPVDGVLTWDRDGTPFNHLVKRVLEDGGRWAMIIDYTPHPDATDLFQALAHVCAEHDIVCEGAWGPRDGEPGRAYLAPHAGLTPAAVMKWLRDAALPCELLQIHPAPPKKNTAAKKPRKQATKKPARKKR